MVRKAAASYQEQHELGRRNATMFCFQGSRDHLGYYRLVRFYSDIIFERDWTPCHVVISLNIRNRSGGIDDGRLGKEVIGEQVKALDPFTLEGCVRKVGCEAR